MVQNPSAGRTTPPSLSPLAVAAEAKPRWQHPRARLARALLADEFRLFGQPIVSGGGADRRVRFIEVLVRLREEEIQCLPPRSFIPVLEEHGMMPMLDRWVLRHATEWLRDRPRAYPGLFVNLARDTLADDAFPADVRTALEQTRVAPEKLVLEVTEDDVATATPAMLGSVRALRALGCGVAISASARNAGWFAPVVLAVANYLKLDARVIADSARAPERTAWLGAILEACKAAGVQPIAEYVESAGAHRSLAALDVHFAQGYAIARPAPLDEIET
jgi:EAL domain-containing protein (putative c-di-GMP-specific phosphodiesterase class I)